MPSLITADEFRDRFDLDGEIADTRIEPHLGSASRRLRKWVTDMTYDAAVAAAQNGQDNDTDVVNDLKNAEAHLAYHFAIFGINAPLSYKGVVATSMSSEGKEMRKYLSPKETAELAGYFLELAREIADPYIAAESDPGFAIVPAAEDDSCEAVTNGAC